MNSKYAIQKCYAHSMFNLAFIRFKSPGHVFCVPDEENVVRQLGEVYNDVWQKNDYARWNLKGKVVVDIGAYYGESCVFFLERGAKRVIAYEPYIGAHFVLTNCVLNNVGVYPGNSDCEVFQAPVLGEAKMVHYNPGDVNVAVTAFFETEKEHSVDIKAWSLDEIYQYLVKDGVKAEECLLKLDCEGAEHAIFASATDAAILQFPKIMMEVHGDKKDIEVRLKRLGYEVDAEYAIEATCMLYAWRTLFRKPR